MAANMLKSLCHELDDYDEASDKLEPTEDMSHPQSDHNFHPQPVEVHEDTDSPLIAWEKIKVKQKKRLMRPLSLKSPISPDKVRFVCVSDTHGKTNRMAPLPEGDVLLHAGDFSMVGKPQELVKFNDWLGTLPHKHKIIIAGNHDMCLDEDMMADNEEGKCRRRIFGLVREQVLQFYAERGIKQAKDLLTHCTYLQDEEISLYGIRIWGSPWQPWFYDWGFNLERGQACLGKWNLIPEGIDVLMTHGPALGYGDLCSSGERAGCVELLSTIQKRVRPKYHVFGHIHEDCGITSDGYTRYINASTCTHSYRPENKPIIFDVPLPPGITKE